MKELLEHLIEEIKSVYYSHHLVLEEKLGNTFSRKIFIIILKNINIPMHFNNKIKSLAKAAGIAVT